MICFTFSSTAAIALSSKRLNSNLLMRPVAHMLPLGAHLREYKDTERLAECKTNQRALLGAVPSLPTCDLALFGRRCEQRSDPGEVAEVDQVVQYGLGIGTRDVLESAIDGGGFAVDLAQGVLNGAHLALHLIHEGAEGGELGLGLGQHTPNLVTFLLDSHGVEAHLEAGQYRHKGGRAGNRHPAVGLD